MMMMMQVRTTRTRQRMMGGEEMQKTKDTNQSQSQIRGTITNMKAEEEMK